MKTARPLEVLHRLNEFHLAESRLEASKQRVEVDAARLRAQQQARQVEQLGQRLAAVIGDRALDALAYCQVSDQLQDCLERLGLIASRQSQEETRLDGIVQQCYGIERRNRTLQRAIDARRAESTRMVDQRLLREMDNLWLQRQESP